MGFKQTSEGRVFFKGPDNDDAPPKKNGKIADPVITSDQTQMQILLLLKSLNAKLKDTKEGSAALKKELTAYKATIKELEEKTAAQENNYIDLEQKLARKHSETDKKAQRVELSAKEAAKRAETAEENAKDALKKLDEARALVKAIEEKHNKEDKSLETIKAEIEERKKQEERLAARQKLIEKQQKDQGEKMVNNVAAYVALTKRVSETEARQASLDNKIDEATSEFIKLDRKIDKALEDRVRMLRKIERIENAVLETRDALNAKAMVLLTNQGSIGGVNMPAIADELIQTDPIALNRRLQEETLMPWWRRPVRLQVPVLVLLGVLTLLCGWIIGEVRENNASSPAPLSQTTGQNIGDQSAAGQIAAPVTTANNGLSFNDLEDTSAYSDSIAQTLAQEEAAAATAAKEAESIAQVADFLSPMPDDAQDTAPATQEAAAPDHGITIHKGSMGNVAAPSENNRIAVKPSSDLDTIDINNEEQMLAVLEQDPEKLAMALNNIEPGVPAKPQAAQAQTISTPPAQEAAPQVQKLEPLPNPPIKYDQAYTQALKRRISPDSNLPDIAKKIEEKAYAGIPEAQHDMGAIYVAGHSTVKKDIGRAILWFEEAAKNGVANARYNLGVLHHQGIGVPVNLERAMALYAEAAQQGHPEAQYNLGIAHIEGIGVAYDPHKAARYFEQAANRNVTEAAYNLGLIYENGLLGETRPDDALMWYKTAADKGSPEAKNALSELAKSLGITLDDVNRIVDRVRQSKQASSAPRSLDGQSERNIIADIQSELTRRGLYSGAIDGRNGPMTANAIKAFQQAASMPATGEPSTDLLNFLRASSQFSADVRF